jgi:N-acetylglucosamine kinase-like BadF-type ATPase
MPLIIGADGGNTKTVAMVCDPEQGVVRGVGRGNSSNWEGMGYEKAAAVITEVAEQALGKAGASRAEVVRLHAGLAGVDWPEDEVRMREALQSLGWRSEITLENDAFSAVRVTAPNGCGIGVTAGTGVASGIIRPDGSKYFYGAFTDLGGGRDIDPRTLQAVIRAEDGRGPATQLTAALLEATGHATVTDLVYAIHRKGRRPPHGALRRVLFTTAAAGDAVAVEIVTRFAGELALCATNLIRRFGLERKCEAVVAAGSLFQRTGPLLFDRFREALAKGAPQAEPILSEQPPLMGAVRGALSAGHCDVPVAWERICESARTGGWLRELGLEAGGDENEEG